MFKKNKDKVQLKKDLMIKWRSLNVDELQVELQELIKKQFKLKLMHSIAELKEKHQLKNVRKNIARLFTLLREKQINKTI